MCHWKTGGKIPLSRIWNSHRASCGGSLRRGWHAAIHHQGDLAAGDGVRAACAVPGEPCLHSHCFSRETWLCGPTQAKGCSRPVVHYGGRCVKITWRNSGPRRRVSRADQAVLSVGVGNRTVRSIFLSFLLLLFVNIINNNTNSLTPLIYV